MVDEVTGDARAREAGLPLANPGRTDRATEGMRRVPGDLTQVKGCCHRRPPFIPHSAQHVAAPREALGCTHRRGRVASHTHSPTAGASKAPAKCPLVKAPAGRPLSCPVTERRAPLKG